MPIPFGLTGAVVTIEIAFATEPFGTTPTWTDVTAYVDAQAGLSISRGRSDAEGAVSPGTCTFTLRNGDGRFTPGYASGAYYPNVQVRKKMRVTVDYESTTYRRFTGYIQSWTVGWPGGVEESATVQVVATDLIGILASTPLKHSHLETILATDPIAVYPLTDGSPPARLQDVEAVVHANAALSDRRREHHAHNESEYRQPRLRRLSRKGGGTIRFAARDAEFRSDPDLRTVKVKNGGDENGDGKTHWSGLSGDIDTKDATTVIAIGGWVRWDGRVGTAEDTHLMSFYAGGSRTLTVLYDASADRLVATLATTPASYGLAFSTADGGIAGDGLWHHIFVRWTPGATDAVELIVDGESAWAEFETTYTTSIEATAQLVIGGAQFSDGTLAYAAPNRAWYSHWAVWIDDAATAVDPADIYEDGRRVVLASSRTSDRVAWLLDRVNFPTADRNIEMGASDVPSSSLSRSSALDYLNAIADSEMGVLFASRAGNAVFHSRTHRYDQTSTATLAWHHPDEEFATDVDSVANVAEVSYRRHGGGTVRLADRSSRVAYGYRATSLSTEVIDENCAHGLAELILEYKATPVPRLSTFTWDILTWPTAVDNQSALSLDIGDRLTLNSLPSPAHDTTTGVWVEGVTETLSLDRWDVSFNTSPSVDVMPDGYWVLGTSTLDTDCYLGF